jgi:superfamily II DNA or RNA helicase
VSSRRSKRKHKHGRIGFVIEAGPPRPKAGGVDEWAQETVPNPGLDLEFRLQVRGRSMVAHLIDPTTRQPLLPAEALATLDEHPTGDRDAVRHLLKFEKPGQKRPTVELEGSDAAELMPHLRGRKVVLEPQMMVLKWADDVLRPVFDLEMGASGETVQVRASFTRSGDSRRLPVAAGAWFEGQPGWHIDAEGIAHAIDKRVTPAALRRIVKQPIIAEPVGELTALIAQGLPKVALAVGADLPELSQVADVVDMTPGFRVVADGSLTDLVVTLFADYDGHETPVSTVGMSMPVLVLPPGEGSRRARCIRADIPAQQEAAFRLRDLGLTPDETGNSFVARGDDAIQFWTDGIGALPEEWDLYTPDDLVDVQLRTEPLGAQARVSSGMDWLSLRLSFGAEGVAVAPDVLARALAEGRRFVRLTDGSFARIDGEKVREVLSRQAEILATSGNTGKFGLAQAGRLQELLDQVGKVQISDEAKELFAKLRTIDEIKGAKKPRTIKAQLRPYQEQGFQWLSFLHEIGSGGVLADDMGLGKTLQTITLLASVKAADDKAGTPFRVLIVAPTSVTTNWVRELEKFAPTMKVHLWHGADRHEDREAMQKAEVVITSYALMRRDEEILGSQQWRYAIIDEAQAIKNPHSATAKAAKKLKADRRLALSGTPIENRLSEIWSIFDFVAPGLLGPLEKFDERYSRPIDNGDKKAAERLRATIHPFILRRTKSEVAKDLPEKIEIDHVCELTGEQHALYQQVLKEVRTQILGEVEKNGVAKSQIQILAALTKLRQAACDPRLLGLPRTFADDDSGKLMALRDLLQTSIAGGHRVLVFSQFVSMLTLVKQALDEDKVAYEYLDGSTKDRQGVVERFQQDGGAPVFLISLKAGGSGLNLTAADTVIHFDPWWNPAVEDQATDRAHRIGQTKVVTMYRLIAKGTIEEKMLELGAKKRDLVASVLAEDEGGAKKLTKADVEDLFRLD